tara:strand:+ start:187 stop:480 length:294 start_codon:yes stop_codon:yes gene_type:complete
MAKHTLKHPFKIFLPSESGDPEEKEITSVEIPDQLTAQHMRAMKVENGTMSAMIDLIAVLAGLTENQVNKMDMEDVTEIVGKLPISADLFQTTGATS